MNNEIYFTKIRPRLDEIAQMAQKKLSKEKIAKNLSIGINTLYKFIHSMPEMALAMKGIGPSFLENEKREKLEGLLMAAYIKRACGYTAKEQVHELKEKTEADGSVKREMLLTKVIQKEVPPDLAALKWCMEQNGGKKSEAVGVSASDEIAAARAIIKERERIEAELDETL